MAQNDIIVPREGANNVLTEIVLADATTSARGLLSASDKTKLDGIAAGAEVNVNADWNASSGDAQILNKPTLGTAAAAATTDFAAASHTHAASAITSGVLDNARVNFAAPSAIGSTTPNTVAATDLSASNKLSLPSAAAASPTAGDLYRNANTIRYRDGTNTERLLLNATDNLSNLANAATARANLGLGTAATANLDALSDSAFRIADNGDATKKLAFELSGISTGTVRTLTAANRSGTVVVSDTSAGTGSDVVNNIVSLTQAEYNAIGSPDAATLYLITDP